MTKYRIHMVYPPDEHKGYEEVTGYPVSIPWLKGVTLFAHRSYGCSPLGEGASYWNISEAKSGLALIVDCPGTKEHALEALKAKLAKIETDDISAWLRAMVDKNILKLGIANPANTGGKG